MKVLLTYPKYEHRDKSPPLGLMYIASLLEENDHQVKIIDFNVDKSSNFISSIQESDILGISCTSQQFHEAQKIANHARKVSPKIKIVVGGPHVTLFESEVFNKMPSVDYLAMGEGEYTLLKLANGNQPDEVKGIIWKSDIGDIYANPSRPIIKNLDEIPFPSRHKVPLERYSYKGSILTSRGCPFRCIYCFKKAGQSYRAHSSAYVLSEMDLMIKNFNISEFHICDDNFLVNPERASEIADGIIGRDWKCEINLWGGSRVDLIAKNESLIAKLAKAGLRRTGLGVESIVQDVLDAAKKDITREEVEEAISILRKYGISFFMFLMVGVPNDQYENVAITKKGIKKNKVKNFGVSLATPYPKTELWKYVHNSGRWLVQPNEAQIDYSYHTVTKVYPMWDTPDFPSDQRMKAIVELFRFSAIRAGFISRDRIALAIKQPRLMLEWFEKWLKQRF
jgi:radical SAM superfamily enzyme YgiQ (UPF0313 family)